MSKNSPKRKYQICKRCAMDTSDPWIIFDERGYCNHCIDFLSNKISSINKNNNKNRNDLHMLFEKIKSKNSSQTTHDVLIGISGGTDSSETLLLAQEAGLKILAIHMDNGWDTPVSIRNINKLVSLKGVDYECEVLDWNNFKLLQRIFINSGLPDIELPTDIAIPAVMYRFAIKYGIKSIISGGNISNEGILPACWMYNVKDTLFAESIIRKSGYSSKIFTPIRYGFRDELKHRFIDKIENFYPLNYFNYDKESAKVELKKKLNWESPVGKHCESTYTKFCQLIYQPKRNKIDYRRASLSTDIVQKRLTRNKALDILKTPPWSEIDVENELNFVSYKLGYDKGELEKIMQMPSKWYSDFPNRKRFLGFSYDIYRFLTGRKKLAQF